MSSKTTFLPSGRFSNLIFRSAFLLLGIGLAGFAQAQTISGSVYFDANDDGAFNGIDVYQPAMSVQLFIDADNDDIADAGELTSTVISDENGEFSFTGVSGKAIIKINSTSLGDGTAARNEIIVPNGQSNTAANLYVIGQSALCYGVADTGDDLVAFNKFNGDVTVVKTNISANNRIEALTTNYGANRLYALDADIFLKLSYSTGNVLNGTGVQIGTISYKNAGGTTSTYNIADADGMAIAGENEIWVSEVAAGGILFKIDTNGNVINNVFENASGTPTYQGVEIVLPAGMPTCGQLDDLAFSPFTEKLYGVYNSCSDGKEYIVEIPTTGTSAGEVTNFTTGGVNLGGTNWSDIEGIGFTSSGFMMGTTGANGNPASQSEHVLVIDESTLQLVSVQEINYAAGGDFESCDCITQKSNPFVQVSISGTVYEDTDGLSDSQVDGTGSSSISGNQLYAYLTDASGSIVAKQNVGTGGTYSFDDLITNYAYYVSISTTSADVGDPAPATANLPGTNSPSGESYGVNNSEGTGIESGTPDMKIKVVTGTSNVTAVDFGYNSTNKITGTVWLDTDGDKVIDGGETERAENVKVYIYADANNDGNLDANPTPIDSVYTNANGEYEYFLGWSSGTESYIVIIDSTTLPAGQQLTTDGKEVASFTGLGQSDANNDFGYKGDPNFIEMTGTVWQDDNEDQTIDGGETVRASNIVVRAYVDANENGTIEDSERATFTEVETDVDGNYSIVKAYTTPVDYLLEVSERQINGDLTTSSTQLAEFTTGGVVDDGNDFGYFAASDELLISGTVFDDLNENAVLNGTDVGEGGVTVYLYRDENNNGILDPGETTAIDTTTTDGAGYYEFLQTYNCVSGTFSTRVSSATDDAREQLDNGTVKHDQNQMMLTEDGKYIDAARFTNITVPQGSEISSANIQFTAKNNGATSGTLTIKGEKVDSSSTFGTTAFSISTKTFTTDSVLWSVDHTNWVKDRASDGELTSDISLIVEEIVGQGSWATGNAMSFFFSGLVGENEAITYDQSTTEAPLLTIEYASNCKDNYIVRIDETTLPTGAILTTDNKELANFTNGGQVDLGNDFGYKILPATQVAIQGTVWNDTDEDGTLDAGESGRASDILIKVYTDANTNGLIDGDEPFEYVSVTTAADGTYTVFLPYDAPVTYLLEIDESSLPADMTTDSVLSASFTAGATAVKDVDFGYNADPTKKYISGTVFNDVNQDTTLNATDRRDEGVEVSLYHDIDGDGVYDSGTDTLITTTLTNSNGFYAFDLDDPCDRDTLEIRISDGIDDGQEKDDTDVKLAENVLQMNNNGQYYNSLRFRNVTIPNGADILSSYVQFTSAKNGEGADGTITINGFDSDNTPIFVAGKNANMTLRTKTTQSKSWSVIKDDWDVDSATLDERTPDLSEIIAEITSRTGWVSSNSLGFIFSNTNDLRVQAYTLEGSINQLGTGIDDYAPLLYVSYEKTCVDNYVLKINETVSATGLPNGAELTTDDIEIALNLIGGGSTDVGNDFGYKFPGSIAGNVFNDNDGLGNSTVDGTGINTPDGNLIYANLVDASGDVLYSTPVNADGTYEFINVPPATYSVEISTNEGTFGLEAPANVLPENWASTGENLGAAAGNDGTVNGILTSITVTTTAVTNANLGINKRPESAISLVEDVEDNGGFSFYTPSSALFKTSTGTTGNENTGDYDGATISSLRLTSFPTNTNAITIDGTTYTDGGNCPTGLTCSAWPGAGVTIAATNGTPDVSIAIDPINGNSTSSIPFVAVDDAGLEDLTEGKVDITFIFNRTLAIDDDNTTFQDSAVSGNVMTNDFDPEGDDQTFGSFLTQDSASAATSGFTVSGIDTAGNTVPNAGTLTFTATGSYTYTPASGFIGEIEVPYSITDDGNPLANDTAILVINVKPELDPTQDGANSIFANDDDIVSYGDPVTSNAFTNDGDPEDDSFYISTYVYDSNGDGTLDATGTLGSAINIGGVDEDGNELSNVGSLELDSLTGEYTFTPVAGFVGTAQVRYTLCDTVSAPHKACEDAIIHITVYDDNGALNDPPLAGDDFATTAMNTVATGSWSGNDLEYNSDSIRFNGFGPVDLDNPAEDTVLTTLNTKKGGTIKILADGTYEYTPPTNYIGPDQASYEICDVTDVNPQPLCDSATIYLMVDPIVRDYGDLDRSKWPIAYNIFKDANNDGIPEGNRPIWLGTSVTNEDSTLVGGGPASGDADDGLIFPADLDTNGAIFKVIVNSTVASTQVYFALYIDWDEDGTFDDTYTGSGTTSSPDTVNVTVNSPPLEDGNFASRLRVTLDPADLSSSGAMTNGETEDYVSTLMPVPVELLYFTAKAEGKTSLLEWETASELNNSHFDIERRSPNSNWEKIGETPGNGTTQEVQYYPFTDYSPLSGVNLYRLRQVDFDGAYEYSNVEVVVFDAVGGIEVYPNPAREMVTIRMTESSRESSEVTLLNMLGQPLQTLKVQTGSETVSFDVSEYAAGIYYVQVVQGTQTQTVKILVDK